MMKKIVIALVAFVSLYVFAGRVTSVSAAMEPGMEAWGEMFLSTPLDSPFLGDGRTRHLDFSVAEEEGEDRGTVYYRVRNANGSLYRYLRVRVRHVDLINHNAWFAGRVVEDTKDPGHVGSWVVFRVKDGSSTESLDQLWVEWVRNGDVARNMVFGHIVPENLYGVTSGYASIPND